MHTFFVDSIDSNRAALSTEDSRHALRVLRMAEGEALAIAHQGRRYLAKLQAQGETAYALIEQELRGTEPRCQIALYQGLLKGERMDYAVQKCVEVGVHRIVPVLMGRCVARHEGDNKKQIRWQRIAREAAVQCGRSLIPIVASPIPFAELAEALPRHEQALVPWEEGGQALPSVYGGAQDVALIIGPEGGIAPEEIAALAATPLTLGPRILRAETAGLVAAAMILTLSGDLA